jgi:Icc-related predicted phosphoesterase
MTIIKLISDLHIDFDDNNLDFIQSIPHDNVDVLICAGDLVTAGNIEKQFDSFKIMSDNFKNVIFVLGNHDFYGHHIQEVYEIINNFQSKLSNFFLLNNSRIIIEGYWFTGCTLWFPQTKPAMHPNWVDYANIKGSEGSSSHDIWQEFNKSYRYLQDNLQQGDILVTHHLGSYEQIASRWRGSRSNCFFVGDIENIILEKKPILHLMGHSHEPLNGLRVGQTLCYRNPRGYPYEDVGFDPGFILDLENFK